MKTAKTPHRPDPAPIHYPMAPVAGVALPFSEAVRVGEMLYVSGQIGLTPGTLQPVPGGIGPEAHQAIKSMQAVLERHGSGLQHVVKCTIFLADIAEWPAFNQVYIQYFRDRLPARSALAASGLAVGARVELECIAYVPPTH